jgi:hypothetical protein
MADQSKKSVLQRLVSVSDSIENINSKLRKFPWDCGEPDISMSMKDMASVLI